jgi:hypothetical protein
LRMPFDDIDADVGIEHRFHGKARLLFCNFGCFRPPSMKSSVNFCKLSMRVAQDVLLGRSTKDAPRFEISTSSPSS